MIVQGRAHLVRTREQLAGDMGVSMGTFRNKKPYVVEGFPAPVSSDGSRVLLWDGEQTAAYLAGTRVPELPAPGAPGDLLDRQEAAAEIGVTPRSWDGYKTDPRLALHAVRVGGVEHWPRAAVCAFRDSRPGRQAATGRPTGKADAVPRGELPRLVAILLDADPAVTIADVCAALGVATATGQRALSRLRSERVAALMKARPALSQEQAAEALGYPAAVRRRPRSSTTTETGSETHG
ncbi:hypothetical protein [Streptomyces xanthophaeus]|uniref:hypothetical protein n=1 Tax=Streptomyces xanthophaeus TaxID=67385 RepID=UPI00371A59C1